MNPNIIYFQDFLCKIKNPLSENYKKLPEDLQEIIYIDIRNILQKEKTRYSKYILHKSLKAHIDPIYKEYEMYKNGAWEYLFHKKNWSLSIEDAYTYYHIDNQIGLNVLNNFRENIS